MQKNDIDCRVLSAEQGSIGCITLQRPKLLNALNQAMCVAIDTQLQRWQNDPEVHAVIIRGEGDRAFCAGGDIRFLYEQGQNNIQPALDFFQIEYQMNRRIFHFSKPYIALLHGVTMGGGLGVSVHGSHRVAARSLVMAMPETGIGFFPDVGGSYFLPRLPGKSGWYLGLTGAKISVDDAYYLGLVDFIIDESDFTDLIGEVCALDLRAETHQQISALLKRWSSSAVASDLALHQNEIDQCFAEKNPQAIFARLQQHNSPWSKTILQTLQTKSPHSLVITCEALARGAELDFDQCMAMELDMAARCLRSADLYEGVRAAIIDKDRKPRWTSSI